MIASLRKWAWVGLVLGLGLGFGGSEAPAADDPCLECHGLPGLGLEGRPLAIHADAFADGIHGRLTCADCHKGADRFPHPPEARVRCDLRCHVPGASHEAIAVAVAEGAHGDAASPACLACHGASWPDPGGPDEVCRSCHPGLDRPRARYPDTPGAFGAVAHERTDRAPGCTTCHGFHGVGSGTSAQAACAGGGCHPGVGADFGRLFDHGGDSGAPGWGGARSLALGLGGLFLAVAILHSGRGRR